MTPNWRTGTMRVFVAHFYFKRISDLPKSTAPNPAHFSTLDAEPDELWSTLRAKDIMPSGLIFREKC